MRHAADSETSEVSGSRNRKRRILETDASNDEVIELLANEVLIASHVPGSVWMVSVQEGDIVETDAALVIVESMKMEMVVAAPKKLRIKKLLATAGMQVQPGTALAIATLVS